MAYQNPDNSSHRRHHASARTSFEEELRNAPLTSEYQFVCPWDPQLESYDISSCNPHLSNGMVTQGDLTQVVHALQTSKRFQPNISFWGRWMVIIMLIVGCVFAVASVARRNKPLLYLPIILGTAFVCILVLASMSKRTRKYQIRRSRDLSNICNQLQETLFKGRNVFLRISPLGSYIIVEFTFKMNHQPALTAPIYAPAPTPVLPPQPQPERMRAYVPPPALLVNKPSQPQYGTNIAQPPNYYQNNTGNVGTPTAGNNGYYTNYPAPAGGNNGPATPFD